MAKINDISKYPVKTELTGEEIILGSERVNTGQTLNIDINAISDYISLNIDVSDYNGTVGLEDSPEDYISGYWIANEIGIYVNFGNVENIWTTGIITLKDEVFTIKEFVQVDTTLEYNNGFII